MIDQTVLEKRLAALEHTVAQLQCQIAHSADKDNWPSALIPKVADEAALLEAMEYARQFRNADRPPDEPGEHK